MISRYSQILQQVQRLSELLKAPGHVQKIYSTAWYLALQIRLPGRTFYLYLGRGGGHEGLWISEQPTPAELRLRDTWLEWCRKNLTSALLVDAQMDPLDRGLRLSFMRGGEVTDLYILWAGRTSYFASYDRSEKKWFIPWGGIPAEGFDVFNQVGRKANSTPEENAKPLPEMSELLKLEKAQLEKQRTPKAKLKSAKVKIAKIEGDLAKIRQWGSLQDWIAAQDPETFSEQREMTFSDLRYKFPVGLSAWQKRDWLFQQVKRLKLAEVKQAERLREAQETFEKILHSPIPEESTLKPIRPVWKSSAPSKAVSKSEHEEYEVHSIEGCKIGVGRTAQGNDQLRKSWAKAQDWWIHAAHGTSAHAIIKLPAEGVPTPEQIKAAAILIAKRSGTTASQLEVIIALVKNVRGVPGAAGMVTYKKNKTLLCDLGEGTLS